MSKTQETGKQGEQLAREYLTSQGYKVLELNWRYKKAEIDLICSKDDQIVIVEVKTRTSTYFGKPEEFVSQHQQDLVFLAANAYLELNNIEKELRFDVIAVVLENPQQVKLKHIQDAFYPGEF